MKRVCNILFITVLFFPLSGISAIYPIEFSDFFAKQQSSVIVRLAGDSVGLKVDAQVSYDDFRLTDAAVVPLRRYLTAKGLASGAVEAITRELTLGVPANPGCKVNLDICAPDVVDKKIEYVFDYDNSNLAIFVGSAWLAHTTQEVNYHPAQSISNALINQSRLYGYVDESSTDSGLNMSNVTALGLPYGYMLFNTQYQSSNGTLDVYKGIYDLEVQGMRAALGYTGRDRIFFNTTDFLNDDADYTSYAAQVGSSRNLTRGGSGRLQLVHFFAPQAGQLEVYQGSRLLLTRVVSQGRQSISYSDLPSGVYDVRLVLRAAGRIVLEESRQIANSQQFSIPVGELDYVFTMGQFDDVPDSDELQWLSSADRFSKNYAQFRTSWRLTDNLLLASSMTTNQDDIFVQTGINYAWSDWLLATYQAGLFSSGDIYQSGTIIVGPISFSTRRFDSNEGNRTYRLASQLYDEQSFLNYGVNYSTSLFGGSGYLAYTHYKSDSPYTFDKILSSKVDDVSAGWMGTWQGWQLGVYSSYSQNEYYDDIKFGLTASYSLGKGLTSQLSMATDKHGLSRSEAGVMKSVSEGDWSGSGTASLGWQRNLQKSEEAMLSGAVNGRTELFSVSAYGYVSSADRRMVSGTLSGTQFISGEGAGMTPDMGTSFMHVVPDITKVKIVDKVSLEGVNYNVRRGENKTYHGRLTGEEAIIPLLPYTDTEFVMDAESRNLHIDNNIRREFVYPGTVYTIDARITPIVTQIFVLNDIQGRPIKQVRCVGEACAGVEPLSDDGVFRVNYLTDGEFTLVSMNRVCINDPELTKDDVVYAYCLPGLMSEEGRIAFSSGERAKANDLLYLGKYTSTHEALAIIDRLKEVGLIAKPVKIGQSIYLYVQHKKAFSLAQRTILEGLEAYIVLNDASVDKLFSAR